MLHFVLEFMLAEMIIIGVINMIRSLIREQFLQQNTDEHDVFKEICESYEWNPDDEDLYQTFKADYDAVIESDWWERVQEEKRMAEWFDKDTYETDLKAFRIEKNLTVRKYG